MALSTVNESRLNKARVVAGPITTVKRRRWTARLRQPPRPFCRFQLLRLLWLPKLLSLLLA
jgi:hypothetical protein